ncbi:MAG: lysylphosphatidylglycerol synthase transmembrane domain-containing protein [Gemmatales bacterium]|nr:flippase-like domain-containing protein [Gemmatales bacterium]MDW7994049.1 lysylphosphatidylglycerol synthase transmembrane domain-containing protein [Gemmatales bacterium]
MGDEVNPRERGESGAENAYARGMSEAPVSSRGRSWRWCLRLGVTVVLLGLLLRGGRTNEVVQRLVGVAWVPLILACGLYAVAQVLSSYRWQWLAQSLGLRVNVGRLVQLYFVGMFFNLFLPTSMGGDVVRSWLLTRLQVGTTFGRAFASVISERLNGLVALLLLGCGASLMVADVLPAWQIGLIWGLGLGGIAGLGLLPVLGRRWAWFRGWAQALSLTTERRTIWWRALALSFVVQALSVLQVMCVAWALNLPSSWQYLVVAVPITTVVSLVPVSVAGLGLRETSLVLLLAPAGWTTAQSMALGLGWFLMQALTSLVGAPLWWLLPSTAESDAAQNRPSAKSELATTIVFFQAEPSHSGPDGPLDTSAEGQNGFFADSPTRSLHTWKQ